MALIDEVRAVCERLAPAGWGELFARHGLDLRAEDLRAELLRELPGIDRGLPGFDDFAAEGARAIEPGRPARSLLYHALASPTVLAGVDGQALGTFPTLAELSLVEDLVFGISPPSLDELAARFPGAPLAIAVFSSEYRPGHETVHRRHADLSLARTGVARVGTAEPQYDPGRRGFLPFIEGDPHAFGVLPARYAAYVAVRLRGREELFGPMNFSLREFLDGTGPGDGSRRFWVPLHKLFSGHECLRGLELSVELEAHHLNEKLCRVHRELRRHGHDTGVPDAELDQPPFRFSAGIAAFSQRPGDGPGVLEPVVHERLVEPAERGGEPVTFAVPPNPQHGLGPSMLVPSDDDFRHAPEFVHVRQLVGPDGEEVDLNDDPNVVDRVRAGGYRARHYVDFTGDGWVEALCPELAVELPRSLPAYSLVTAPDFYPSTEQRELVEWWLQRLPAEIRERVWGTRPLALSDERLVANLQLQGAGFRTDDDTITAIVSLPAVGPPAQRPIGRSFVARHPHLPDGAAGVFAPGWDTSRDRTDGVAHLATYGLGSPFPEDAKLCAALSAFWPAAAPDSGRSFSRSFPTTTPLTDEELGSTGELPWDGVPGPRPSEDGSALEYASFDHVDYVRSALEGSFSLALTGRVGPSEVCRARTRDGARLRVLGRDRARGRRLDARVLPQGRGRRSGPHGGRARGRSAPSRTALSVRLRAPALREDRCRRPPEGARRARRAGHSSGGRAAARAPTARERLLARGAAALATDVAVVGAGPAGASAAIACAQRGLRVLLCELRCFPRERVGETLHPGAEPVLERIGVWDRVREAGFLRHEGIWVGSPECRRFEPYGSDANGPWRGFQAWRADLDAILLERASELGAETLQPCRALEPRLSGCRVTGLRTSAGDIRARIVVDAAGSQHWLARRLGLSLRRRSPRLIARYGYVRGRCAERDEAPAFLSDQSGWTWTAHVRPGVYQWTRLNLTGSPPPADWLPQELRGLEPGPATGAEVGWRALAPSAGPGYYAVGDAATVVDPASSHGVLRALMSGLLAGRLIADGVLDGAEERSGASAYQAWTEDWFERDVTRRDLPQPPSWLA